MGEYIFTPTHKIIAKVEKLVKQIVVCFLAAAFLGGFAFFADFLADETTQLKNTL